MKLKSNYKYLTGLMTIRTQLCVLTTPGMVMVHFVFTIKMARRAEHYVFFFEKLSFASTVDEGQKIAQTLSNTLSLCYTLEFSVF